MRKPAVKARIGAIAGLSTVAVAIVAVTFIAVARAQLAASVWPMFLHDVRHTGLSTVNTSAIGASEQWNFAAGGSWYSSPSLGFDGTIYIGNESNGYIYAINPDGSQKWAFQTGATVYLSSPAIGADGTIYVGSGDRLYALTDGGQGSVTEKWAYLTGGPVESSPVIGSDGTIYVGSDDDNLYALTDGGPGTVTKKWAFATGNDVESSPAIGSDGTIYVGSDDTTFTR